MANTKMENGEHMECPICGEWLFWSEDGISDCLVADAAPDLLSVLQVIFNRVMYESPTAEIGVVFDDEMIARVRGVLNKAEDKS